MKKVLCVVAFAMFMNICGAENLSLKWGDDHKPLKEALYSSAVNEQLVADNQIRIMNEKAMILTEYWLNYRTGLWFGLCSRKLECGLYDHDAEAQKYFFERKYSYTDEQIDTSLKTVSSEILSVLFDIEADLLSQHSDLEKFKEAVDKYWEEEKSWYFDHMKERLEEWCSGSTVWHLYLYDLTPKQYEKYLSVPLRNTEDETIKMRNAYKNKILADLPRYEKRLELLESLSLERVALRVEKILRLREKGMFYKHLVGRG